MEGFVGLEQTHSEFRTTCWTVIESLRGADPAERHRCLEELARRYWPPVYGYLRRHGQNREHAAEVTQAFFCDVVLQRELFERAVQGRGRLRSLILSALKNFRIDLSRRAAVRGAGWQMPADPERLDHAAGSLDGDPHDAFDREWAAAVLQEALRRAQRHFTDHGRERHWRLFEQRVLQPATTGGVARPLAEFAAEEGFGSPADAAAAVQVVKKRVQALMEEVVAETVGSGELVADELRAVLACLK